MPALPLLALLASVMLVGAGIPDAAARSALLLGGGTVQAEALDALTLLPDGTVLSAADVALGLEALSPADGDVLVRGGDRGTAGRYDDVAPFPLGALPDFIGPALAVYDRATGLFAPYDPASGDLATVLATAGTLVVLDTGAGLVPPGMLSLVDASLTDDCPNDTDKTVPERCGCGIPDVDQNGDGVADCCLDDEDCNDDDECTDNDRCVDGVCLHDAVVCPRPSSECTAATCDAFDGCTETPRADGMSCGGGDACVQTGACTAGACVETALTPFASADCRLAGLLDATSCAASDARLSTTLHTRVGLVQQLVHQASTATARRKFVRFVGKARKQLKSLRKPIAKSFKRRHIDMPCRDRLLQLIDDRRTEVGALTR